MLDEATSALNTETERAIQQSLADLSEGCTTLVIALKLPTIANADRIRLARMAELSNKGPMPSCLSASTVIIMGSAQAGSPSAWSLSARRLLPRAGCGYSPPERTHPTNHHAAQILSLLSRHSLLVSQRGGRTAPRGRFAGTEPELVGPANGNPVSGRFGLYANSESSAAFFRGLMDRFTIAYFAVPANESHIACLARVFEKTIPSAKAWIYIANVRLITWRIATA